jgi:hypothetical protein
MSTKERFFEKLQIKSKDKLQKLKEEKQEKQRKHNKFSNIFPLQSRSPKEVRHFHLLFLILLLKDFLRCLSLKGLLKRLERTTKITNKL